MVFVVGGVYPKAATTLVFVIPIVTLSLSASGVRVTLLPFNVKVSVLLSASTVLVLPEIATLLNAFWFTSAPDAIPDNLFFSVVV